MLSREARLLLAAWLLALAAIGAAHAGERAYGVATHFAMRGHDLSTLPALAATGANALRDEVYWSDVEREPGVLRVPARVDAYVDAALALGIAPTLVLGYGNPAWDGGGKPASAAARAAFARYAAFVVAHFRGRVRRYEIWNEWDIAIGGTQPGTPAGFVALVGAALPALRASDGEAQFVAGGVTPEALRSGWLRRAVAAGLLRDVDGLALHTYNYRDAAATPEAWRDELERVARAMPNWRPPGEPRICPPLFVTEMGWPNHFGRGGIGADLQAAYAARAFLLAAGIDALRGIWWYTLADEGRNVFAADARFGLIDSDGGAKPAAAALGAILPWLRRARTAAPRDDLPAPWQHWRYELDDGRVYEALWRGDDGTGDVRARCATCADAALPPPCRAGAARAAIDLRVGPEPCVLAGGPWTLEPSS